MKLLLVACSIPAYRLMERIREEWQKNHPEDTVYSLVKCNALLEVTEKGSLTAHIGEWFPRTDAIVFLCAAGIAVRCIAPFITHKAKDPAIVVMDETGAFSIALLSGHVGGANRLAEELAGLTGAVPVITTASEREGKMAVDIFAAGNRLALTDWQTAKELEARILAGEKIGLTVDEELQLSLCGEPPEYLLLGARAVGCQAGIQVSIRRNGKAACRERPFPQTLQLIPRRVCLGIGCRKGAEAAQIARAVEDCLKEQNICREAVCMAASIDLKKEEAGILEFCNGFSEEMHRKEPLPFLTFSAEELGRQKGRFTTSEFVSAVTGVDNVCERSALAACCRETEGGGQGRLLCRKFVRDGVTVALALGAGILTVSQELSGK
ncbi:MAG: cobalamin biosynthesis protein [Roseburia sp.]|nr:cobalamin biosynthesis protein [Roseburia sp.]